MSANAGPATLDSGAGSVVLPAPSRLAQLGLTPVEQVCLASQGFVSQETRGAGRRHYKLRFRVHGRQRVRYLGDARVAEEVRQELAILRSPRRRKRAMLKLAALGRQTLRESKRRLAPLLEPQGQRFHGYCLRRSRHVPADPAKSLDPLSLSPLHSEESLTMREPALAPEESLSLAESFQEPLKESTSAPSPAGSRAIEPELEEREFQEQRLQTVRNLQVAAMQQADARAATTDLIAGELASLALAMGPSLRSALLDGDLARPELVLLRPFLQVTRQFGQLIQTGRQGSQVGAGPPRSPARRGEANVEAFDTHAGGLTESDAEPDTDPDIEPDAGAAPAA